MQDPGKRWRDTTWRRAESYPPLPARDLEPMPHWAKWMVGFAVVLIVLVLWWPAIKVLATRWGV